MRRGAPLRERLHSSLTIEPTGCLLWTGGLDRYGYGRLKVDGSMRRVHRLMWELHEGPVPAGLELDHLCRVRRCASIAHLEPVTGKENILRGRNWSALNAAKDRCDSGHLFTEANTYMTPSGARGCRACNREAVRRYSARKAARRAAERTTA